MQKTSCIRRRRESDDDTYETAKDSPHVGRRRRRDEDADPGRMKS
jgi:hypothetical protein